MSNVPVLRIELALKGRSIKKFKFTQASVTIGRDPDADIVLDNMGVSRIHARIECVDGTCFVRDEGSSNGTFVNGSRADNQRLIDQDVISIGKFSLLVAIAAGAGDAQRPEPRTADATAHEPDGTMVLTTDQLARVLKCTPDSQPAAQPVLGIVERTADAGRRPASAIPVLPWILAVIGALLVGMAIGAAVF
jgi:pSer/pThr/pTyr-binding forkhead associated (FHA) protein